MQIPDVFFDRMQKEMGEFPPICRISVKFKNRGINIKKNRVKRKWEKEKKKKPKITNRNKRKKLYNEVEDAPRINTYSGVITPSEIKELLSE